MSHFSQMLRQQNPKNPPVLKDQVTGEIVPWTSSYFDKLLIPAIPDEQRRRQLLTLMGPPGCKFCTQLLKNQGGSKIIFPHLLFKNNIPDKPNQATIYPFARYCPMLHTATLEARLKLLATFPPSIFCNICLRNTRGCICDKPPRKSSDICTSQNCAKHMMICGHKLAKDQVEVESK